MPWWGWIVIGIVLLGAELGIVDAAFYLVFLGISALIVGVLDLSGLAVLPMWGEWLLFSVLALVSMVLFRQRLYELIRSDSEAMHEPELEQLIRIEQHLDPGGTARVEHRGSQWTVRNVGSEPIHPGSEARITRVDGLVLHVTRAAD